MPKSVTFRMNGVGNAFLRELGCSPCPQCNAVKPRANTSGSLIISDWKSSRGRLENHLLFDCGVGVTDSLIDYGISTITSIFVSHSHPDHNLDLDRIANSYCRSGHPIPLALYCTDGTLDQGPRRLYPWFFPNTLAHQSVEPGKPINLGLDINLRVTPIAVWHGKNPKDPVIWVVEFGDRSKESYRKIIVGWDLLHLVPRYLNDDADGDYSGPVEHSTKLVQSHKTLLENADELFIEANTYAACPATGHISADAVMRSLIPMLTPRRTWLVHYSGHEDPFGPLSDAELQLKLDHGKLAHGLATHDLFVAEHGMTLTWSL